MRSSRVDTFSLVTLGRLTLLSPSGVESESLSKRRVKLALLAVLATAKRPISRCTLAEMFWGEQDETRARHSLSDALSHLRRELGRRAIVSRGADVSLAPDAQLVVDANQFVDAADARDLPRAAALYAGPFMEGVDIESSPSFEHWVTRERRRLETLFLQVCAQQCLAHARAREWEQCGSLASRWLDAAPLSVDAALFRLNAVKAAGTREAAQRALDEYEQLTSRLARDYDLLPEQPVRQLAQNIRETLGTLPREPEPVAPPAPPATTPVVPDTQHSPAPNVALPVPAAALPMPRPVYRALGRRLRRLATSGVAGVALLAAVAASARTPGGRVPTRPRVAVAIDVRDADSATAWLKDGLPQMIVSELSRSPDLEVLPAAQVRALLRRRGPTTHSPQTEDDLRDLARRLGATVIVNGTIGRDDHALVLDLTVRDAATGRLLRSDALSRPGAAALADEAAARVLVTVNAERPGLRFAELETSSVEAYQNFMHAMAAEQEGRAHEAIRYLDAAIALDSGFVSAVHTRMDHAIMSWDAGVAERLRLVLARTGDRATEFDRLQTDVYDAMSAGDFERSEAIARQLLRRYPRDPRSYNALAGILGNHQRLAAAEQVWQQAIALDSLTMEAGSGPCAPCGMYGALARVQAQQGKWAAAERSARRWIELQPDAPAAWQVLGWLLAYQHRDRDAIGAVQRAASLSGRDASSLDALARVLVMLRRFDEVDSLVTPWLNSESADLRSSAHDIRVLLLRERGQFRASNIEAEAMRAGTPNDQSVANLMEGSNLGHLGDYAGVIQVYERSAHPARQPLIFPPSGTATRGFCWHHALMADALGTSNDVARLRAIADTLEIGCAKSFYGRDRVLYHHVRGLIAMNEGRWIEAIAELRQGMWGISEGWTRTSVALARAELMLGQPRVALGTLRNAYASPLDGMSRYQPRSELDFLMAQAFQRAGQTDSAEVYMAYARRAWRNADPEVKRLLEPESVVASR